MSVKSPITKQSENEIKAKKQKENQMKTTTSSKLNPKSWVSHDTWVTLRTLLTIATIAALLSIGWYARGEYEASLNNQVQTKVQAITANTPSKQ